LFVSLSPIRFRFARPQVEFALQHFQVDNQVAQDYAVLLAPRRLADAKPLPFIQFSVNRAASAASSIMLFNYVSLLVQEFDIQVEEPIIWALLELINDLGLAGSAGGGKSGPLQSSAPMLALDVNSVLAAPATRATALFFAFLQLQPLAVNLRYVLQRCSQIWQLNNYVPLPLVFSNEKIKILGPVSAI
jgi:hypothetical protein